MNTLARHCFVWPAVDAVAGVSQCGTGTPDPNVIRDWLSTGRPAIVRRRLEDDAAESLPVGVALPNAYGRRRIAFQIDPSQIIRSSPAPDILQVIDTAPYEWRPALKRITEDSRDDCRTVRVYGSLAWQALTGLAYLTGTSDLDLLVDVESKQDIDWALSHFEKWNAQAPMRIDGEIVLPGGGGISWRELARGERSVLVKRAERVGIEKAEILKSALL